MNTLLFAMSTAGLLLLSPGANTAPAAKADGCCCTSCSCTNCTCGQNCSDCCGTSCSMAKAEKPVEAACCSTVMSCCK